MNEQSSIYICPCCGGKNTTQSTIKLTTLCKDCGEFVTIWDKEENITKEEYNRLKRLDEDVKKLISDMKNEDHDDTHCSCTVIDLLERLCE